MEENFEILSQCPLFSGISREDLSGMLQCLGARSVSYEKGRTVFLEGDPALWVGVVLTGEVQILREDLDGNRSILAAAGPGQLFGEVFACAQLDRLPVTVIASADSRILQLACRRIIETCSQSCIFHSQLIHNLLKIVARKNLMLNQKIDFISRRTTREKLMAYLTAQAKAADSRIFSIPYNRQELADYLGVERSAMSAELGKLKKEGTIDFHRNHFTLKDKTAKEDLK